MGVNKVELKNGETLLDLSGDTVVPEALREGYTAHDKSGQPISGTLKESSPSLIRLEGLEAKYVSAKHITVDISPKAEGYQNIAASQIIVEFAQIGAYEASLSRVSSLYKSYTPSTGLIDITTSENLFRSNKKNIVNIYIAG